MLFQYKAPIQITNIQPPFSFMFSFRVSRNSWVSPSSFSMSSVWIHDSWLIQLSISIKCIFFNVEKQKRLLQGAFYI